MADSMTTSMSFSGIEPPFSSWRVAGRGSVSSLQDGKNDDELLLHRSPETATDLPKARPPYLMKGSGTVTISVVPEVKVRRRSLRSEWRAHLRLSVQCVPARVGRISIDQGQPDPKVSPLQKVESETSNRWGRRFDFQRLGVLLNRLSK